MPLGNLSEVNFADNFKNETIRIVEPITKALKLKNKKIELNKKNYHIFIIENVEKKKIIQLILNQ